MSETVKWRGGQVTRLEALTDAVFGFAITLLFVSFDVPRTFDGLVAQLQGFFAFALCFACIILVWVYHYKLFTRFDMDDGWTVFLNSVLLFVVLFYVYPLKFVFNSVINALFFDGPKFLSDDQTQLPAMMAIYGAGFVAVFLVFGLMFLHAYRQRERMQLNDDDVIYALSQAGECGVMCLVGLVAIVAAYVVPWYLAGLTGFIYMFIGPAQFIHGTWAAKHWPKHVLMTKGTTTYSATS